MLNNKLRKKNIYHVTRAINTNLLIAVLYLLIRDVLLNKNN